VTGPLKTFVVIVLSAAYLGHGDPQFRGSGRARTVTGGVRAAGPTQRNLDCTLHPCRVQWRPHVSYVWPDGVSLTCPPGAGPLIDCAAVLKPFLKTASAFRGAALSRFNKAPPLC